MDVVSGGTGKGAHTNPDAHDGAAPKTSIDFSDSKSLPRVGLTVHAWWSTYQHSVLSARNGPANLPSACLMHQVRHCVFIPSRRQQTV